MILRPGVMAFFAAAALAACGCAGAGRTQVSGYAAVAAKVAPSLVRVEYALKYDKGKPPRCGGWTEGGCPVRKRDSLDVETPIEEERPLETPGFLVSPTRVVAPDPMIHPRFVAGVMVRQGHETVRASPVAWAKYEKAVFLELERPVEGGKPLAFDRLCKPPYLAVTYDDAGGTWAVGVEAFSPALVVDENGRRVVPAPMHALITASDGTPVGLSMNGSIAADDSWKGSPLAWPTCSAEQRDALLKHVEAVAERSIVRVTLHLRSPRKDVTRRYRSGDEDEEATEIHALGIMLQPGRVLVLAQLKPRVTARLERVIVHPPHGDGVAAVFECSLSDYGALTARLERDLAGAMELSSADVCDLRCRFLPAAEIEVKGDNRTAYFDHRRIYALNTGWRRQAYPEIPGDEGNLFLFDADGALVAMPIARRPRPGVDQQQVAEEPVLTAVSSLAQVLADPVAHGDPHNVPLSEEQESRLAWLGVELQPLSRDLARASRVADLTSDGETGALVTYVYEDSPAAKAGVETGDILLRLHVEGWPKPVEVVLDDSPDEGPFPWDRLDELPEQYYNEIPPPWPSVQNQFTRTLTDLGFGRRFQAELFRDGKVLIKTFEVVESPPHYDSAPRYKAPALGLTVRNLTYEVRRYFQRGPQEPGVIVSRIEPGSKASVAGIKPFEIITHVNDKPVLNVGDFQRAVAGQAELRLSVKRMTQGRVVKIVTTGPAPAER